ncbi:MAG: EAL domain-containing protein [Lachnospiraceae bacterium]|nr:EAL domain-containing protein [Lachnospiraceae bacterium]
MRKFVEFLEKVENISFIRSIRAGMVTIIPVLLLGSFSLVLKGLPIMVYQKFISAFLGGAILELFNFIYNATFGMLSVYMAATISVSYSRIKMERPYNMFGMPITATACFFILTGMPQEGLVQGFFGASCMLSSIFSAVVTSVMYSRISKEVEKRLKYFGEGADLEFNSAISAMIPFSIVVSVFAVFSILLSNIFKVSNFQELVVYAVSWIFSRVEVSFTNGCLYVIISNVLWFFGVHGSNVLMNVIRTFFTNGLEMNALAVALGKVPTEFLTKEFFYVFVHIGGCGASLCLLIAIFLFGKARNNRCLGKMAAIPMLFNINELMVFGLPIIFNPILFFPFVFTPVVLFFTTYIAMATGIVPLITATVEWTTPVILGGYIATGSYKGSILQILNIVIGVLIYKPFLRIYEEEKINSASKMIIELTNTLKENELCGQANLLTELMDNRGAMAKMLAMDLKRAIGNDDLMLYYQPQYNNEGKCIGAESLLRWEHKEFGMIYPPLAIQLAQEMGFLNSLEKYVFNKAVNDIGTIKTQIPYQIKIGVNVSGRTIQSDDFEQFLKEKFICSSLKKGDICVEVTEQLALKNNVVTDERLGRIKEIGYIMAIDDFSMGHTSLKYLQENHFDVVKLDGSLVMGMNENARCKDIISSIIYLSKGLGFKVIAEYVETETQRSELESMGCMIYQGYLYSEAIPLDRFIKRLKEET